jgi:hypothetical protein
MRRVTQQVAEVGIETTGAATLQRVTQQVAEVGIETTGGATMTRITQVVWEVATADLEPALGIGGRRRGMVRRG